MFQYVSKGGSDGFDLLPAGVYPARVVKAEEGVSKAGNPMMALSLLCTDEETGRRATVRDYLVLSESTLWKVDQFMGAIGKLPKEGEVVAVLPHLIVGASCYVRLGVERGERRDFNRCEALLSAEEGLAQKAGPSSSSASSFADSVKFSSYKDFSKYDDIPF